MTTYLFDFLCSMYHLLFTSIARQHFHAWSTWRHGCFYLRTLHIPTLSINQSICTTHVETCLKFREIEMSWHISFANVINTKVHSKQLNHSTHNQTINSLTICSCFLDKRILLSARRLIMWTIKQCEHVMNTPKWWLWKVSSHAHDVPSSTHVLHSFSKFSQSRERSFTHDFKLWYNLCRLKNCANFTSQRQQLPRR